MKKFFIILTLLFWVNLFPEIIYQPFKIDYKKDLNDFSFYLRADNTESYSFGIKYENYKILYTEQKIFKRTIKLKSGERSFVSGVNFPVYNGNYSGFFQYGYTNKQLLGIISENIFIKTEYNQNGFKNFISGNLRVKAPNIINFTAETSYYDDNITKKDNFFSIATYINIPKFLKSYYINDYTSGHFYSGIILGENSEKGLSLGIASGEKIVPAVGLNFNIEISGKKYEISSKLYFEEKTDFNILIKYSDIKMPVLLMISKDGCGIFAEL